MLFVSMRRSAKRALHLLESLKHGHSALLFYDDDTTLEEFLFQYVKTGLQNNETVFYWTGINSVTKIEQKMSHYGIDRDSYNGALNILSYDEIFTPDGRIDLSHGYKKLFSMLKHSNGNYSRLATESNWWLLADVFERGMEMETAHEMIPSNISIVCSYNIANLMDYVNIYHLAKLMELHNNTLVVTKHSVMLPLQFYSLLGKCIIDVLEENFDYITIVRRKHSRFISEILLELEMRIGSDMIELEKNVEEKLMHVLRL